MPDITIQKDSWKSMQADGEFGRVFVITETVYSYEGKVLKRQKHRRPIEPDADISEEPIVIKRVCEVIRTPEALARFEKVKPVEVVSRGD